MFVVGLDSNLKFTTCAICLRFSTWQVKNIRNLHHDVQVKFFCINSRKLILQPRLNPRITEAARMKLNLKKRAINWILTRCEWTLNHFYKLTVVNVNLIYQKNQIISKKSRWNRNDEKKRRLNETTLMAWFRQRKYIVEIILLSHFMLHEGKKKESSNVVLRPWLINMKMSWFSFSLILHSRREPSLTPSNTNKTVFQRSLEVFISEIYRCKNELL